MLTGSGVLDEKNMKAFDDWMDALKPAAEAAYEKCRAEAEAKLGGPVRLVGNTFGDLTRPPSYIFERVPE